MKAKVFAVVSTWTNGATEIEDVSMEPIDLREFMEAVEWPHKQVLVGLCVTEQVIEIPDVDARTRRRRKQGS